MKNLNEISANYPVVQEEWTPLRMMVREREFNIFKTHANGTVNVLEIGLGDGGFLRQLAAAFNNVLAVDGSSFIIEKVRHSLRNFKNIEYIESYAETLKSNSTYDNIVMSHILEHIENPVEALKNVANIMHGESVIYISVPNADSIHRQVAVEMGLLERCDSLNETDIAVGHCRVYTLKMLREHAEAAGIKVIASGGVMLKPLSNGQISKFFTTEMVKGFIAVGDRYPELCGDIYVVGRKCE